MNDRSNDRWATRLVLSAMTVVLAAGCGTSSSRTRAADPHADTMTMAEMRMDEAGGPSMAATPAGIAHPVAEPTAPGPDALTDAGLNTPLGKQWIFTKVDGFDGELPGPPKNASLMMSRGNGRMGGTTSCNPMSAAFEIDLVQATLKFRNVTSGNAMCGRLNVDVERAVIDALVATETFLMDGRTLTLMGKGGYPVAALVTP